MGINWRKPTEAAPVFYTFTTRADFDEYVRSCNDIYLADLPSKILRGKLVLSTDPIVLKDKTYNVVGAWFDIDQPAFIDDDGSYCAKPWGFIAILSATGFRTRHRAGSWQSVASLRTRMLAIPGAVVTFRREL